MVLNLKYYVYMCIYLYLYMCGYFLALSTIKAQKQWPASEYPHTQVLVLRHYFSLKETSASWGNNVWFQVWGQETHMMSLEQLVISGSRGAIKNKWGHRTKVLRCQPEEVLTSQRWDSLSFNNSNFNEPKPIKYV